MSYPIIDIHEFLDLAPLDMWMLLESHGVFLGRIDTAVKSMELYALGSFYVERNVSKSSVFNADDAIVPFMKGPRLDKYLDAIDLSGLLS